jgi:hypothetical protein
MTDVISNQDADSLIKLMAESAAVPGPLAERRRKLLSELSGLINADLWVWVINSRMAPPTGTAAPVVTLPMGNWTSETQRDHFFRACTSAEYAELLAPALAPLHGTHFTHTRDQLFPGGSFHRSAFHARWWKGFGLDDFILSLYPLPRGGTSGVGFHRFTGRLPFTERERCLVHVVTSSVDWLHTDCPNVPLAAADSLAGSPQLRFILLMVLAGHGRREIAGKMGLSEHTVGEYMKDLYGRFGVNSRGELAAMMMEGGGDGEEC